MRLVKKRKVLMSLLVVLICLAGCGDQTQPSGTSESPGNNTSEQEPSPQETTQNQAEPITLVASTHSPPNIPMTDAWDAFLDEIEKRSDGQLTFERYYSGSLASGYDVIDKMVSGVVDVALVFPSWQSGKMPLGTVGSMPSIYQDSLAATKAITELYANSSELQQEVDNANIVAIGFLQAPPQYFVASKPISSFEDLKGLRVQTNDEAQAIIAEELGMAAVSVPFTEAYDAITKGTIDAVMFGVLTAISFGVHEEAKYAWKLPLTGIAGMYGMSKQAWDQLPDELKTIIEEIKNDFQPESFYQIYQAGEEHFEDVYKQAGGEIVEATEEDVNTMRELAAEKVWQTWVKEQEERGLPGQAILDQFRQLIQKYEQQ